MRGDDPQPDAMFSYVSVEQRVPADHPLRIRGLVDEVLRDISREFDGLHARMGRPSISPERPLRAQLLQIFYSIRSELRDSYSGSASAETEQLLLGVIRGAKRLRLRGRF